MNQDSSLSLKKINGFSGGLHPLQGFAYFAYAAAITVFAITSGVLYYISVAAMAALAFYCSYSDPTDPVILLERQAKLQNQEFDTADYEYYCNSCVSHVQNGSKHCRQCDRCVNDFDHHCKWLNNCIGKQNYKAFLGLIASVFINSCIYCAFMIYALLSKYGNDFEEELFVGKSFGTYLVMKIFVWTFLIFVGILGILDFNLLLFHIWLTSNLLTTYEYIVNSRAAQQENRPYGICAGVKDEENNQKQTPNNANEEPSRQQSNITLPQLESSTNAQQKKTCCCMPSRSRNCLKFWRSKKEASITPIVPGLEGNHEFNKEKQRNSLARDARARQFGQDVIEGLIEKSICNSADVREDEMMTEICKQEQQLLQQQELNIVSTPMTAMMKLPNGNNNGGVVVGSGKPVFGIDSQVSSEQKLHTKSYRGQKDKILKNSSGILVDDYDEEIGQQLEKAHNHEKNNQNTDQENSDKKLSSSQHIQQQQLQLDVKKFTSVFDGENSEKGLIRKKSGTLQNQSKRRSKSRMNTMEMKETPSSSQISLYSQPSKQMGSPMSQLFGMNEPVQFVVDQIDEYENQSDHNSVTKKDDEEVSQVNQVNDQFSQNRRRKNQISQVADSRKSSHSIKYDEEDDFNCEEKAARAWENKKNEENQGDDPMSGVIQQKHLHQQQNLRKIHDNNFF